MSTSSIIRSIVMKTLAIPSRSFGNRWPMMSAAADISAGSSIDSSGKMQR